MLIVTGGCNDDIHLASTEVTDHSNGEHWREVASLPSPRRGILMMKPICYFHCFMLSGLRGATLSNLFHVTGGTNTSEYFDSILAWDPVAETWSEVGRLKNGRCYHGIAPVAINDISDLCT